MTSLEDTQHSPHPATRAMPHLVCLLLVLAHAEAAEHVLEGRGVQVLLQVVEGVLRHVGHTQVGVAPGGAAGGLVLAWRLGGQKGEQEQVSSMT
jgi:hypothetical protein